MDCRSITDYHFKVVNYVDEGAFINNLVLSKIYLEVESIHQRTFANCINLTQIIAPKLK